MSGHQKVIATGHLGADPSIKSIDGGGTVTELRIAVGETWRDRAGNRVEHTEWLRIKAFGRDAETAGQFLSKGRLITVEGRLRTEKWQASDGSDRYSTWVYADPGGIRWHGGREHTETRPEHRGRAVTSDTLTPASNRPAANLEQQCSDDDLPF